MSNSKKELKQHQHELLPLDRKDVPHDVLAIIEDEHDCDIEEMKRFRARNIRRTPNTGFAFVTSTGKVIVVEEECQMKQGNSIVPAWSVTVTSCPAEKPLDNIIDRLFCRQFVTLVFSAYSVPVANPKAKKTANAK